MIDKLNSLKPSVLPFFTGFITKLEKSGLPYFVLETFRTQEAQDAYYAQGRETLDTINEKRKRAGFTPIGAAEGKRIITNAKHSVHQDRQAADIVPILEGEKIPWDYAKYKDLWLCFGRLGMEAGLEWGGGKNWTPLLPCGLGWDPPHYQKIA
jgi:hypothetical protein